MKALRSLSKLYETSRPLVTLGKSSYTPIRSQTSILWAPGTRTKDLPTYRGRSELLSGTCHLLKSWTRLIYCSRKNARPYHATRRASSTLRARCQRPRSIDNRCLLVSFSALDALNSAGRLVLCVYMPKRTADLVEIEGALSPYVQCHRGSWSGLSR